MRKELIKKRTQESQMYMNLIIVSKYKKKMSKEQITNSIVTPGDF